MQATAFEHLKRHVLAVEPLPALTEAHFNQAVERARSRLAGLAVQLADRLTTVLQLRQQLQQKLGVALPAIAAPPRAAPRVLTDLSQLGQVVPRAAPSPSNPLAGELLRLLPPRFLERIPFARLAHLPRFLKALTIRAERRALNPLKDDERARQLAPYVEALRGFEARPAPPGELAERIEAFRWLVEEFRVSLFAQELGTSVPVSPKRLDQELEAIRFLVR